MTRIPESPHYGHYQCKSCGKHKRAWVESLCYLQSLCPTCLDSYSDFADQEMGIDPITTKEG